MAVFELTEDIKNNSKQKEEREINSVIHIKELRRQLRAERQRVQLYALKVNSEQTSVQNFYKFYNKDYQFLSKTNF